MEGLAPFRSLELGVTRFRGTDEGSTFQHLSHNGPNLPNPSEYDPMAVYNRLFGAPTDARLNLARQSVLDVVTTQISDLRGELGASDRARLDQHLDSVRTLELRLGEDIGACGDLSPPEIITDGSLEPIDEKNVVMSDLLALALACDLTRVFSIQFSTCGSGVVMWQVGATNGLHGVCHEEALPQPTVAAATVFTMEQLAVFLRTLRDTPEGDGNLLDRCSILCTTELSDGRTHSNLEFPILIAGGGNGRLRGGVHYRDTDYENASTAVLTALHGAGVELGLGRGRGPHHPDLLRAVGLIGCAPVAPRQDRRYRDLRTEEDPWRRCGSLRSPWRLRSPAETRPTPPTPAATGPTAPMGRMGPTAPMGRTAPMAPMAPTGRGSRPASRTARPQRGTPPISTPSASAATRSTPASATAAAARPTFRLQARPVLHGERPGVRPEIIHEGPRTPEAYPTESVDSTDAHEGGLAGGLWRLTGEMSSTSRPPTAPRA